VEEGLLRASRFTSFFSPVLALGYFLCTTGTRQALAAFLFFVFLCLGLLGVPT
jgi:MFS-type transporter involved in bile tolerance (Atg22 family)